jgi:transcriptional regulator with XRE-family HTH domain
VSIGDRILLALKQSGKNQADLARHLSTKPSTVTGWIKEGHIPSASVVVPICEFTGISTDWLLTGEGEPTVVQPQPLALTETEDLLLEEYRAADKQKRKAILQAALGTSHEPKGETL